MACLTEKKRLEHITGVSEQHFIHNSFSSPSPARKARKLLSILLISQPLGALFGQYLHVKKTRFICEQIKLAAANTLIRSQYYQHIRHCFRCAKRCNTEEAKIQEGQLEGEIWWHYTSSPAKYEVKVKCLYSLQWVRTNLLQCNIELGLKIKKTRCFSYIKNKTICKIRRWSHSPLGLPWQLIQTSSCP